MKFLLWIALLAQFSCQNDKNNGMVVSLNFSDVFVIFIVADQSEISNKTLLDFETIEAVSLDDNGRAYLINGEGRFRVRDLEIQYQNKILIVDSKEVNTNERGVVITKNNAIHTRNLYWLYEGGLREFF